MPVSCFPWCFEQLSKVLQSMPWRCSVCCLGFPTRFLLLQHLSSNEHCHFANQIVQFAYGVSSKDLSVIHSLRCAAYYMCTIYIIIQLCRGGIHRIIKDCQHSSSVLTEHSTFRCLPATGVTQAFSMQPILGSQEVQNRK